MSVGEGFDWLASAGEDAALLLAAQDAFGFRLRLPAKVAVAVSGGSDSMAMLHLMARAAPHAGWSLHAVTVDHRLRPEAAEEAAFVGRICERLGVPHEVLVWEHGEIAGNLMEAAREARYALMTGWARKRGIARVALAHTADDQAETFLMGLARSAGIDGLTGMRHRLVRDGVTFLRPFLAFPRAGLRAYLARHGLSWIEDPSNEDDRFTRVKARRALKALRPLGITVDRLFAVVRNLSLAQSVVHQAVSRTGKEIMSETAGSLRFDRRPFLLCGPEVQRRLLISMVGWIGGARHPPRESKIFALGMALDRKKDATLGGVRFRWQGETCWICREARSCGGPVLAGQVWDGRWRLTGLADAVPADAEIRALGPLGLRQCPDWRAAGLPRHVLEVTPGLWQGQTLIAAPCAGFGPGAATCTPSFADHLLSH